MSQAECDRADNVIFFNWLLNMITVDNVHECRFSALVAWNPSITVPNTGIEWCHLAPIH